MNHDETIIPRGAKIEIKAPLDAIPQERFTGDVMKGRGPRRGNLERLLRYWRPIMRKEGGFRRCRVILADHPELYPLNNICAWLHHETTGLWPNEGCHHPGMKNCRKKARGVIRGSLWNDNEFDSRLRKLTSRSGGKSLVYSGIEGGEEPFSPMVTPADLEHAINVLSDFIEMEPDWVQYINSNDTWLHLGDSDEGVGIIHPRMSAPGCTCGKC